MSLGIFTGLMIVLLVSLGGFTIFHRLRCRFSLERLRHPLESALSEMVAPLRATIGDLAATRLRWSGVEITAQNIRLLSNDDHTWVSFSKITLQKPLSALLSPTALLDKPLATPLRFSGAVVDALVPQAPFDSLHGLARMTENSMRFEIFGGTWGAATITQGTVRLDDLGTSSVGANISFCCNTSAENAVEFVNFSPLTVIDLSTIESSKIQGSVDADVRLAFRFNELAKVEHQIKAKISDLRISNGPAGLPLTHGQMSVTVTNGATTIDGTTDVGGTPTTFRFSKPSSDLPGSLRINTSEFGALVASLHISGRLQGGDLQTTLCRERDSDRWSGHIDLHRVRILQAPLLARLLTMASLQGLLSTLTNDGLTVEHARSEVTIDSKIIRCSSIRISIDQLEITGSVAINLEAGLIEGKGLLIPAAVLQRLVGSVPVLGALLNGLGKKNTPLVATRFTLSGPLAFPEITIHPLMGLAPEILRELGLS